MPLQGVAPAPGPSRGLAIAALLVLAAVWRLWVGGRFYGWEESDYGNLMMAQGVLDSGFTAFDMNHMPMYYAIAAAMTALVGDTVVATRIVSLFAGLTSLLVLVVAAWRAAGWRAALLGGLLIAIQPEFALYSTSALREPVYTALLVASLALLARERPLLAAFVGGAAFLTRMDALFVLAPLACFHALGRPPRWIRFFSVFAPIGVIVFAWAFYCHAVHGTWQFWSHSVGVNIETGGGLEASDRLAWTWNGLRIVAALLFQTLPGHMGWPLAIMAWIGVPILLLSGFGPLRVIGGGLLTATAFWLVIAFTAQHEPGHNLYWKWMYPLVPLWGFAAGVGLDRSMAWLRRRMGGVGAAALVGFALILTWRVQYLETERQITLSQALYKPQLDLARSIEASISPEVPMIVDNIPGCWLRRSPAEWQLWTWMDVPSTPGDPDAFTRWLQAEHIGWVLWFHEDWTQAPIIAPFLAGGGRVDLGALVLEEEAREDQYGWIWYRVRAPAIDVPGGAR